MAAKQVKSRQRVADHGEVFTADREVKAMCDLVKQETERIATATKGKAFSTKTSDDLPNVLSDIFSSIYKLEGKQLALVNGNVRIKVENSSIFYVNIIIKSNFIAEELNPKLKNPNKEDVPIEGNENVKMTSAGT